MKTTITIVLDEELERRARAVAKRRDTSLPDLLQRYVESLASQHSLESASDELLDLMSAPGGRSGGAPLEREAAYEGRT